MSRFENGNRFSGGRRSGARNKLGVRRVPVNVKVQRATAGSSASWVGQGWSTPVSSLALDLITLDPYKVGGTRRDDGCGR